LVSGEELGYSGDPGQWGFDIKRDLVCVSDARGYFVSLNKAWEESLGGTRAELQSRPYMELVHDDDVERTRREAARAVEPDYEIVDFENRFRHKDGSYRWLRWSARSDGDQLFAVAFDVTERKRDEERLLRTLTEDHLLAYSQPIMEQRSRRIEHEELLVRMRGDAAGDVVLLPEAFLPAAEQLGFIGIVDRWMLDRAIAVAASGRRMEINLSARSISDANLVNDLCAAVDAAPQSARRLTFEISLDGTRPFTFSYFDYASDPTRTVTMAEPLAVDCLGELFGGGDRLVGPARRWREDDLGAVHPQQLDPLAGDVLRHHADQPVAPQRGHHRQRDAGVAAGRLQDGVPRPEGAGRLGGPHHPQRRPVLDRAGGVAVLQLGPDPHRVRRREPRQPHQGGAADRGQR
jgi:PAS domain S-box-containing protein